MANLEDKINTSLDQVIATDWRGQGKGEGRQGVRPKKGRGRGSSKGRGLGVRRAIKGGGKGGGGSAGKGKGKGKDAGMSRGPRARGLVKKTLFSKQRRTLPTWGKPDKGWGKGTVRRSKGKGKGKSKGKRSNWSDGGEASGAVVQRLWKGARSKGKGQGKGKRQEKGNGKMRNLRPQNGKGKGKGKSRGKGKGRATSQASDGYAVRRSIAKRQPGTRPRTSDKGKGKGKGMARAFALATGSNFARRGSWGKAGGKGREREERHERGRDAEVMEKLSAEDRRMMKKITIVAQLDKVPKPTPAMQGFNMGSRGGNSSAERGGSLSRRFGARRDR